MSRKPIEDIYPLSPLQTGLLATSLDPRHAGAYFQQATCELAGGLDAGAWRHAWEQAVARHTILRTAFVWDRRDEPFQIVFRAVRLPWLEEDWRGLPASEQQARLDAHLRADLERGFDLRQAPLLRFALFRTGEHAHRFVWSYHHLLVDGWSLMVLFDEVFSLYREALRGRELELGRPRPFRDYVEWLRRRDVAAAERFWRHALRGLTAPTPLPTDREAPAADTVAGETYAFRQRFLTVEASAALQDLGRRHGLTLSTVFQGAWGLLLGRAAGETEAVFGATFSGRTPELPGVESMIGPFINTLPVRVRLDPEAPAADWLARLQADLVELREMEHSPLAEVQRWSELPPGVSLFETIVVCQNFPRRSLDAAAPGLAIRDVTAVERAHYPLGLRVNPGERISLEIGYDRRRRSDSFVLSLLERLETLLAALADRPQTPIGDLPLIPDAERQAIAAGNRTAAPYADTACVHELFALQAAGAPDALAILFAQPGEPDQGLSYGELDARSNRLARHLCTLGVGPEVPVGIFLDRSLDMVVAILGVLKAGGAYVPLDPAQPAERLARMLAEAGLPLLITAEKRLAALPAQPLWTICLDDCAGEGTCIAGQSAEPLARTAVPDNLAYLLYTSGSTGAPKGVLVRHQGICNLAAAEIREFSLAPGDRVLQFASLGFDASTWEIFPALLAGATLCLAPRESLLPGPAMTRLLAELGISHATLPPTVLAALPPGCETALPALRVLVSAGEACTAETVARWAPGRRFWNAYGPSETTVCATWAECLPDGRKPGIGRPIANTGVHLVDRRLQPVPFGVAGELLVAAVGLARGYWARPDLSAERFIPDPFAATPGARLYRTGDLACRRVGGDLEFLGRLDEQVKLRGVRIEPGEIQAALARHPSVRDSAVVVREDFPGPGERRLVAYVVRRDDAGPLGEAHQSALWRELRAHLRRLLPEAMVPAAFVELSALPLSPHGKVDRRALPAPSREPERERSVAPRTPAEETLARLFREVLHLDQAGVEDSFFDLGGDSILAVQLVSRAVQSGLHLTPTQLFQHPTVAALAEALQDATPAPSGGPLIGSSVLIPLQPHGDGRPLFLIHTGTGSVLPYRALVRHLGRERPIHGLQIPDLFAEREGWGRIEEIAGSYLAALRTVQPRGPYCLAGHSGGALVAYEIARQLEARGEETALLAILDNPSPAECRREEKGSASMVVSMVNLVKRFYGDALAVTDEDLRPLSPDDRLALLLDHLKRQELAPADAGLAWVRGFLAVQEALGRAVREYSARAAASEAASAAHAIPILLLRTGELTALYGEAGGDFGWGRCTTLPVSVHDIPGDHVSLLTEPHVRAVAAALAARLAETDAASSPWIAPHLLQPTAQGVEPA